MTNSDGPSFSAPLSDESMRILSSLLGKRITSALVPAMRREGNVLSWAPSLGVTANGRNRWTVVWAEDCETARGFEYSQLNVSEEIEFRDANYGKKCRPEFDPTKFAFDGSSDLVQVSIIEWFGHCSSTEADGCQGPAQDLASDGIIEFVLADDRAFCVGAMASQADFLCFRLGRFEEGPLDSFMHPQEYRRRLTLH
jgi:hypothetical protein